MKEKLRKELSMLATKFMSNDQIQLFDICVTGLLHEYEISAKQTEIIACDNKNDKYIKTYIATLRLEGKSEGTIKQYFDAIQAMLSDIDKNLCDITTNDIRFHLSNYQAHHNVSNTTVDNKRRFLSAFFRWLTVENIIPKNPMLQIKKVKDKYCCKKIFTDEELERMRNHTCDIIDRALMEVLLSTGCRVSEVSQANITDIDFAKGECVVTGKGNKERIVYINDKAMYYLQQYLNTRSDHTSPLFINCRGNRMSKETIRKRLNKISQVSHVSHVHPHRFRRTMATTLCKHGMSVKYIQKILGHTKIETTMIYCMINNDLVRAAYKQIA